MKPLSLFAAWLCAGVVVADVSAAVPLPGGRKIEQVDFERHVMPVFSKAGCNLGSCHGSFQGKGGFRLSLFGYEPAMDFKGLTRDVMGRRLNPADPDRSLILLKATGQVPHEGGVRFGRNSWQYQLLRSWIAGGAGWDAGRGEVVALNIAGTTDQLFVQRRQTKKLVVQARYADGSEEVVTPLCEYRTTDDAIAEVTANGEVTARSPGDTGLMVSYRGAVVAVRVLVPMPASGIQNYPKIPEVNYIDREVFAKLRKLNMIPSELTDDTEFLRRVTIDTIGLLPTPQEVREFLADRSADKRDRKIEELLAHPLHAAVWATKLSDITGNNTELLEQPQQLRPRRSQQWHDWLRARVAENRPWDEIVRRILTATSRDNRPIDQWLEATLKSDELLDKAFDPTYAEKETLDLFWRRQQPVPLEQWGEKVAAAFLGVRLECAQCHKHPTDRWTQIDYRSFANVFQQVATGISPEAKKLVDPINAERRANAPRNNQFNQIRELFLADTSRNRGRQARSRAFTHPDTDEPLPAKSLGGPEISLEGGDARAELWQWMRSPENPFFARSFVNRVWAHYFGIGLVDPVDDFSIANPPSNARLLDALARDFIDSGYDIRALERRVLQSRTYQLSSKPNATNHLDKNNFARGYIRPMMAEVVVDVLNSALGVDEQLGDDAPKGAKITEIGSTRLANANLAYVLRVFGRPPRSTACDCERAMDPALPQTLYRMTDPAVLAKLRDPKGRLVTLAKNKSLTDDEVIDELFLATLSRFPTADERAAFERHRSATTDRYAYLTDAMWALINTREFILNH